MGGPIEVPGHIAKLPVMESTSERAETFATNLRAVTVGVKNARSTVIALAAPEWQGDAADAHDNAATAQANRLDVASAALDVAVTAADRFEERLSRLKLQRAAINGDVHAVNQLTAALVLEINAATDDSQDAEFRSRAVKLCRRAHHIEQRQTTWLTTYDDAESDFIAALQRVDTVTEGKQAAADPHRVDVNALISAFDKRKDGPKALAAWWASLTRAQKEAITTEGPELVGNANGLPSRDRDEANRAAVYNDIDYLSQRKADGEITSDEQDKLDNAKTVRQALDDYRDDVDPLTGRERGYVLVYKPGGYKGDGGIAFSLGNPDLADNVSAYVPGFGNDVSGLGDKLKDMDHLASAAAGNGSVATGLWLDYDAPSGNPFSDPRDLIDLPNVALPFDADIAGHRFADFIDGLHNSDQGDPAHFTTIGHSYGSVVAGHALGVYGAKTDDAILVGSPGQPLPNAGMYRHTGHIWVGAMDNDPVSLLGQTFTPRPDGITGVTGTLGYDPAQDTFGATRFATGDGSLRIEDLFKNHTGYFKGESLDNMGRIVCGDTGEVTYQDNRNGYNYQTLPELIGTSGANSALHGLEHAGESALHTLEGIANPYNWLPHFP